MKSYRLLTACMVAAVAAAPALADRLEYRVLTQSRDIGHLTFDREGGRISADYDYKQNGRGPTIKEVLLLDKDGAPQRWTITGRTTFGNAVNESFLRGPRAASWRDLAGQIGRASCRERVLLMV